MDTEGLKEGVSLQGRRVWRNHVKTTGWRAKTCRNTRNNAVGKHWGQIYDDDEARNAFMNISFGEAWIFPGTCWEKQRNEEQLRSLESAGRTTGTCRLATRRMRFGLSSIRSARWRGECDSLFCAPIFVTTLVRERMLVVFVRSLAGSSKNRLSDA